MKISKEIKIGLIAIAVIVAFFWLFNFLKGKNFLTSGRVFYVTYSDVDGLAPSKPVNLNGLKIGRVESIDIKEKPDSVYFVVKMVVERDIEFSKNTVAEIYEPGLLEGKMIKLNLDYTGPKAMSGDTLRSATNSSLMDIVSNQIGPTKNKVDSVLVSLDKTLTSINKLADDDTSQSLKSLLKKLNGTVAAFEQTANSLTRTSDNANQMISKTQQEMVGISGNAKQTLASADQTLDKYGKLADKFQNLEVEKSIKNLENATASLQATLEKFENSDGTLNKMIEDPELYNNLTQATTNLNVLLEDFKNNPSKYIQFSVFGKKNKK